MERVTNKLLIMLMAIMLNACGGGSGGGSFASGPGTGAGGTGIAAVTGFSSVIMNDNRVFTVDNNTQFFLDGNAINLSQIQTNNSGVGLMARYQVADDVNASITSGTLTVVQLENIVKGPVTSTNPLRVLGQDVIVTGNTVLVNSLDIATLQTGDEVEVSGYGNNSNGMQASRIEKKASIPVWKILGNVSSVSAGSFQMGALTVNLNGVMPGNCGAGLADGNAVEVKADRVNGFGSGSPLNSVTQVECRTLALTIPSNASSNSLAAEIEGIVTTLSTTQPPHDFFIRQQRVITTATTVYEGGKAGDITLAARLEAEGTLDTSTGILTATKVRFRQNRVRIEAPLNVPGGGLGSSFTIMDIINVETTSLTEDKDGLVSGSGTPGNQQVEVRGFVDKNGKVFAERVRERGNADPNKVRLRGPATDSCDPAAGDNEFAILGVIVDTQSALSFFDSRSTTIPLSNSTELCNLISVGTSGFGTSVQAEDGAFSSPPARIDNAQKIEIED